MATQIRADIPGEGEPQLRDLVLGSQLDWSSSGWPLREESTQVSPKNGLLELQHPKDAYDAHCRAYMPDVLSALRCHVDVRASDGRTLILKYCASYLPKFSSSFAQEMLNDQATGFALARRILADYHPLQPEMVLQLAAQQLPQFLSSAVVRKFCVPVPWRQDAPKWVRDYMACGWRRRSTSLLQYLRLAGSNGQIAQCYRRYHSMNKLETPLVDWIRTCPNLGKIAVACTMYSYGNDAYFGQWLLLHVPFNAVDDLWDERAASLPRELRYLGLCLLHRPDFWRDLRNLAEQMESEARTFVYSQNVLALVRARIELVDAYLSGELQLSTDARTKPEATTQIDRADFAPDQGFAYMTVMRKVMQALEHRWPEDGDERSWGAWVTATRAAVVERPTAVLGPAGSGKSTAVQAAIREAVRASARVGVACPTGLLATRYKVDNPDLDVDTVHGMFALHKAEQSTLEMMVAYDLVVIDEIGQVPLWIFERILRLWDAADRRPALVFVGDFCQLRGPDGTFATQSARWSEVTVLRLHSMRRCKCASLRWKLELLRGHTPTQPQLRKILARHRAYASNGPPSAEAIQQVLGKRPSTQFVTITRRGSARINALVVRVLFRDQEPLGVIATDPEDNPANFRGTARVGAEPLKMPIFEGMRVTLTKNEDKQQGFVNGMGGRIRRLRTSGVEVVLDNGNITLVHPTTQDYELATGDFCRTTALPLRPGYSTTLHKIQGATLGHITIWLDVPFVRGAAYVALSRVRKDADWQFLGTISRRECLPAECP
ncbi:pif1 [Symbiodinium sp. CCMP2592]|nr:pif1 [Symbiodinium sp. CCMP2592]